MAPPAARRRMGGGRTARTPTPQPFRPARNHPSAHARRFYGAPASEIHPVPHGIRPAHPGARTAAAGFETPRGGEPGYRDDARGRCFELDARRGFPAQPPRTHQIRHRQALRRTQAGSRGTGRLRGRRRSATADHLGLPHGQSLCPQNIPFDGFGAGHRHRSGPLAGHHVLFGKGR